MSSSRSFTRAALGALLLSALPGCAPRRDVLVNLRPLPAEASAIEIIASLAQGGDSPAAEARAVYEGEPVRRVAAQLRDASLALALPFEASGALTLAAAVYGQDRCLLALGEGAPVDVTVADAERKATIDLTDLTAQRCPAMRPAEGAPLIAEVRAGATSGPISSAGDEPLVIRGFGFDQRPAVTLGIAEGAMSTRAGQPVAVRRSSLLQLEGQTPRLDKPLGQTLRLVVENKGRGAATWDQLRAYERRVTFAEPVRRELRLDADGRAIGSGSPGFLAAGYVDADQRRDLVVGWVNRQALYHVLYGGDGEQAFAVPFAFTIPGFQAAQWNFALADFDEDQRDDLLSLGIGSGQGNVRLRLNKGTRDNPFPADVGPLIALPFASNVAALDTNGDGRRDVLVAAATGTSAASLTVLLNQGGGQFALGNGASASCAVDDGASGYLGYNLPLGDLTGDGRLSPILKVSSSGLFPAFGAYPLDPRGRCSSSTPSVLMGVPNAGDTRTAAGDIDDDNRADLIIGLQGKLYLALNDGAGGLGPTAIPIPLNLAGDVGGTVFGDLALADLNGDEAPELVVLSNNRGAIGSRPGRLTILFNLRAGKGRVPFTDSPESRQTFDAAQIPSSPVVADLNNDARPDIALLSGDGDNAVLLYYNQPEAAP